MELKEIIERCNIELYKDDRKISLEMVEKMIACMKESERDMNRCCYILSSGRRCRKQKEKCFHPKQWFKVPVIELLD